MDIVSKVGAFILADPQMRSDVGTRFYPVKLPQNPTLPAITIQRITGVRANKLKGPASLVDARYQIDIWAREGSGSAFKTTQRIGRRLALLLDGRTTTLLDDEVSPAVPRIVAFRLETDQDLFEPDVNGGIYRYSADYFITYQTGAND